MRRCRRKLENSAINLAGAVYNGPGKVKSAWWRGVLGGLRTEQFSGKEGTPNVRSEHRVWEPAVKNDGPLWSFPWQLQDFEEIQFL